MVKSIGGKTLIITIGGGSHEPEMTLKMEGVPAGYTIRGKKINEILGRRAPGNNPLSTTRKETDLAYLKENDNWTPLTDEFQFTTPKNGVLEFIIKNKNHNSKEYQLELPRPGHADLPAHIKYQGQVNMSGGGPFSGRMTAMYTLAGAVAMEILATQNIHVGSSILSIGKVSDQSLDLLNPKASAHGLTDEMEQEILRAKAELDSVGGVVEGYVTGLDAGIGGPMFDGLETLLSPLLFAIPAVKGVEFGQGFNGANLKGSQNNDGILGFNNKKIFTETNNGGGILGGISTGMPLVLRVAFKPTPSIGKPQKTVNLKTGLCEQLTINGRHDPCIVPRAGVVVEAVMALGILDAIVSDKKAGLPSNQLGACRETPNLGALREGIDQLDDMIVELLNQRMEISKAVARYKIDNQVSVKDRRREDQILAKVGDDYKDIYQEIFKVSRKLQQEITDKHKFIKSK